MLWLSLMLAPVSTGQVDTRQEGSGFGTHPAVLDNCMQLGPVSGGLGSADDQATGGTRIVGGIAAFLVAPAAQRERSSWAAAERAPAAADGLVCSSHWLLGHEGGRIHLRDLQVSILRPRDVPTSITCTEYDRPVQDGRDAMWVPCIY